MKTQVIAEVPALACAWRGRGFLPLRDRIRLMKQPAPGLARRACAALLLAVLTLGGGFAAWAAQPAGDRIVTDPDWVSMPGAADLARYYPKKASAKGVGGIAVLRCRVERTGALSRCTVMREAPAGYGFGDAMLRMAPLFRMKPMSVNGHPVAGAIVLVPVKFQLRD